MEQTKLEALLGRTLTAREVTNKTLYLNIAKQNLQDMLCLQLDCGNSFEPRTFKAREGYSTVFLGTFTDVGEVKVDGEVVTDYHSAFFDNRNSKFYNSIVFDNRFRKEATIEITASWGFESLPNDLAQLWAQMFAITSKKYSTGSVKSKQVEDFRITYGDATDEQVFADQNALTISKYSLCNVGYVLHGSVCKLHHVRYCGYCL